MLLDPEMGWACVPASDYRMQRPGTTFPFQTLVEVLSKGTVIALPCLSLFGDALNVQHAGERKIVEAVIHCDRSQECAKGEA